MSDISFRPLEAEDIEVRVAQCSDKGVSLLLYKDARCDMRILDDAVGAENWQCEYKSIDGNLFCSVGIKYDLTDDLSEWVYKQDVGTPSNMEGEKGCASDAFKRACFKWGIGRELYTAPFIWVSKGDCNITKNAKGKHVCYDRFSVESIKIEDGRIKSVKIKNDKTGKTVFPKRGNHAKPKENQSNGLSVKEKRIIRINELTNEAVSLGVKREGIEGYVYGNFNRPLNELTEDELVTVGKHVAGLIDAKKELANGPSS